MQHCTSKYVIFVSLVNDDTIHASHLCCVFHNPFTGISCLTSAGHDIFASGNADGGSIKSASRSLDAAALSMQREGVFHILVLIPIACALIQLLAWSQFNLCGKRLQWIKHVRQGAQYSFV